MDKKPASKPLPKTHIVELISKGLEYTVYDTKWIPSSRRCIVAGSRPNATGALQVFKMQTQEKEQLMKLSDITTESAIRCTTFAAADPIQRHIALGDFKGQVITYDLNDIEKKPVFQHKVHDDIINCIDGGGAPGPCEIVTGSRDGKVCVCDTRSPDPVVAVLEPEGDKRDCWSVSMGGTNGPSERSVIAGYDNGDLKLWDLKSNQVTWETNLRNGIASMQFSDRTGPLKRVTCGCLTGQLVTFDLTDKPQDKGYRSHVTKVKDSATIWVIQHCPQRRDVIATTGGSGELMIWRKNKKDLVLDKITTSQFSTQPICAFDWHPDKEGLAVMGAFDQTVRIALITHLQP